VLCNKFILNPKILKSGFRFINRKKTINKCFVILILADGQFFFEVSKKHEEWFYNYSLFKADIRYKELRDKNDDVMFNYYRNLHPEVITEIYRIEESMYKDLVGGN
jgi:hypothetical protein